MLITGFTGTPRPLDSAQDLPVSSLLLERIFLFQRTLGWGWEGHGEGRVKEGEGQEMPDWKWLEAARKGMVALPSPQDEKF